MIMYKRRLVKFVESSQHTLLPITGGLPSGLGLAPCLVHGVVFLNKFLIWKY